MKHGQPVAVTSFLQSGRREIRAGLQVVILFREPKMHRFRRPIRRRMFQNVFFFHSKKSALKGLQIVAEKIFAPTRILFNIP